jgi:hypothetical protein
MRLLWEIQILIKQIATYLIKSGNVLKLYVPEIARFSPENINIMNEHITM